MTEEAQRIAIAGACPGWRVGDETGMSSLVHWLDKDGVRMLSNPLEDLNAMHEAEETLSALDAEHYAYEIEKVAARIVTKHCRMFKNCHGTAAQRAEAFLRAKGLWVETPAP